MSEREHGKLFGRGDNLGDPEPPPMDAMVVIPPYFNPVPFGAPPSEPVTLDGEIPWELRDDDSAAPAVVHPDAR